jgi:prepilin-type processing-associated H-X9-DG protein/prepilin-type N-terminal cleavage/methylation domain-containing protein
MECGNIVVDMKRVGFTLTELLVVIAVIAALVAMILPVSRAVKQRAKAVMCKSNLKQLSMALTVYEHENGTFPYAFDRTNINPPPTGYAGIGTFDFRGWWWFHFLTATLGKDFEKETVLWCPSRKIRESSSKANILCENYGVNRAICKDAQERGNNEFFGAPLSLDQIPHPARTLLMIDSGYSLISWWGTTNATAPGRPFENPMRTGAFYVPGSAINKEREISPGFESDALDGRHPNRTVNVVFADGHSARLKADDLFVEEIDGKYTNRSPLWLPR